MKVHKRSPGQFWNSILILALLQGSMMSHFSIIKIAADKFHVNETRELQRSIARYRHSIERDESRRNLLQVEETSLEQSNEQNLPSMTQTDGAVHHPENNEDESQLGQSENVAPTVHKDSKGEGDESAHKYTAEHDNSNSENTELERQQQLDLIETKAAEQQHESEAQTRVEEAEFKIEEQKRNSEEKTVEQPEFKIEDQSSKKSEKVKTERQQQESAQKSIEEPNFQAGQLQEEKSEEEKSGEPELKANERMQNSEGKEVAEGDSQNEQDERGKEQKAADSEATKEEPFVFPEPYLLGPTIKDWDEQRAGWLKANPHMETSKDGKPRVLIVTGSQPGPCRSPVGDNFHIKSLKLKIDYARMHNYEIYYSLAWLDPLFGSYWVKLPIVRKLMLTHPEIEWFFWMDSDAVFTDMLFEAPFHTYEGYNMIMWGYDYGFYTQKSWTAFNAGVFILRNCQWSLDLIDKWSPMGPDGPVNVEYGKILTAFLADRKDNYPADDQSALAYLILTDEEVKSKVKLINLNDYMVSAWWIEVVDSYETCMEKYHPGLGDLRWPWITHFTGCGPCGGDHDGAEYAKCIRNIGRAFNFADNQVLAYMGFQHESLSSPTVIRTRNETEQPLQFVGVNPWETRIAEVAAAAAAVEGSTNA